MSGVMGSLIQTLQHFPWASHQQFTQIIQLRALRPVLKGSPDISSLQFSRPCLESPIYSGYPAKVELPRAKENNPFDSEIRVPGCRSQAGEGQGTEPAVPLTSYFLLPLNSDNGRRLQKAYSLIF